MSVTRKLKRALQLRVARSKPFALFVASLERLDRHRPNLLRVLTYHRVDIPGNRASLAGRLISATPETFNRQMRYLGENYQPVSAAQAVEACRGNLILPRRAVLVTFDDAYRDFAEHAWPILKRHRIPAALFVPTAFPDRPRLAFWWDRLYHALHATSLRDELDTPVGRLPLATGARRLRTCNRLIDYTKTLNHHPAMDFVRQICRRLDAPPPENHVLGWDALRRLAREGVTLGAHTRTHALLNRTSLTEARAEIIDSLDDLNREIGSTLPIFAYPAGGLNDRVVDLLQREGFAAAFTTLGGINKMPPADPLRLRRINVGLGTTLPILRARLSNCPF